MGGQLEEWTKLGYQAFCVDMMGSMIDMLIKYLINSIFKKKKKLFIHSTCDSLNRREKCDLRKCSSPANLL